MTDKPDPDPNRQGSSPPRAVRLDRRRDHASAPAGMLIVVDDEDRENEGDLTMAASKVTPEAINFMARHGRGLICLAMMPERLDELEIPLEVSDNSSRRDTAMCVSIDARDGTTTGISAADRAQTVRVAIDRRIDAARSGAARARVSAAGPRAAACSCARDTPKRPSISPASPASSRPA